MWERVSLDFQLDRRGSTENLRGAMLPKKKDKFK